MKGYLTKQCEDQITGSVMGFNILKDLTLLTNDIVKTFNSIVNGIMFDVRYDRGKPELYLEVSCDNTQDNNLPENIKQELSSITGMKYPAFYIQYDTQSQSIIQAQETSDRAKPIDVTTDIKKCKNFIKALKSIPYNTTRLHIKMAL